MTSLVRVIWRDADQPMNAYLRFEITVNIFAGDRTRRALEPRLVAGCEIDNVACKTTGIRPASVHTQEHLRPIARLCTTRTSIDSENSRGGILLAGKHALKLELSKLLIDNVELAFSLVRELSAIALAHEFKDRFHVGKFANQAFIALYDCIQTVALFSEFLRTLLIVPEIWII